MGERKSMCDAGVAVGDPLFVLKRVIFTQDNIARHTPRYVVGSNEVYFSVNHKTTYTDLLTRDRYTMHKLFQSITIFN